MKHTMFLIQSLRRTKPTVSTLLHRPIITTSDSISRPPFPPAAAPPLPDRVFQGRIYAPFFTRAGDNNPGPIQSIPAQELARAHQQARDQGNFNRERLWNLLRWSSPVPVLLAVFWYLEKLESTNEMTNSGEELRQEKFGEMKKPNEFRASNAWEGLPTFELFHYSFYLSFFYALSLFRSQPPKFGPSLAFFFTLISFIGCLFSRVASNLADYNALTSKAPFFYQLSGAWSNHEGSLLLWVLILTFYCFIFRRGHGKYY